MTNRSILPHLCRALSCLALAARLCHGVETGRGIGHSTAPEPRAAGREAASAALARLGQAPAKLVLVFASRGLVTDELVEGISSVFSSVPVYGCESYSPLVPDTNFADQGHTAPNATAVLALGGDIGITLAAEDSTGPDGYRGCGRRLGETLKAAIVPTVGHLLLTFGDQHVGDANRDLLAGLQDAVGRDLRIAGAAAGGPEAREIVAGKIVTHTNVAILLSGDLHVRTTTRGGQGDLVQKAREALTAVVHTGAAAPRLVFLFDCGGRRGELHGQGKLAAEHQAMRDALGDTPFFGFYGGGEIGAPDDTAAAGAVGFSISAAALYPGPAPAPAAIPVNARGAPFADWRKHSGAWKATPAGIVAQTEVKPDARFLAPPAAAAGDFDLRLRARKKSGNEGFLVLFRVKDDSTFYWWNIAGWNNTRHAIERSVEGKRQVIVDAPGSVETGRWYDIRVLAEGERLRCYLDGVLVHDFTDSGTPVRQGGIGLGTWMTAAEFTGLTLLDLPGGRTVLQTSDAPAQAEAAALSNPAWQPLPPFGQWRAVEGRWTARDDNSFAQTSLTANCRAFAPGQAPADFVLETKARKTAGHEGFLVIFRAASDHDFYWWNVAGWANTRHGLEKKGAKGNAILAQVPGSVETGRDYTLRVTVQGSRIRCWLDGRLVHDLRDQSFTAGAVGLGTWNTAAEYCDVRLAELVDPGDTSDAFYRHGKTFADSLTASIDARRQDGRATGTAALLRALSRDFPAEMRTFRRAAGGDSALADWLETADDSLLQRLAGYAVATSELAPGSGRTAARLWQAAQAARDRALAACPPIAFVCRNGYGMDGTNGTMFSHRTGTGSEVLTWNPRTPDVPPVCIFRTETGFVWDLYPSFDGRRLLMSCKAEVWEPFHIWEVGVDGSGLRQVTQGNWHDFNPVYLPGGRIAFASSRVESYSLCQDFLACALHTCAADGTDVRRIDFTTLCTNAPALLPDGSLIATRWEYQDKNIFSWQGLWSIAPSGRGLRLYYGNTLTIPNSLYGARPVPGRPEQVVITMAAHHYPPIGDLALIDRRRGVENPDGLRQITFATQYRVTQGKDYRDPNWGPGDRFYPHAYADPWPVNRDLILAAYGGTAEGEQHFRICAVLASGTQVTLWEDPQRQAFYPVTLSPSAVPVQIAGEAPPGAGLGTFLVGDVNRGLVEQGVARGTVERLRVMEVLPKKYNTEGPRYHDHYPAIGHGSYYVKRILGEVPVRPDGSAWFRAPANTELYFIGLDRDGKEVQRMGSVTQITPDEMVTCSGCHENRLSAPPAGARATIPAGKPDEITPPPYGDGGPVAVDFVRQVQPVLDRHCARCHSGAAPKAGLDLSGDKTRFFNMAFENLTLRGLVDYYFINPGPTGVFPARQTGSAVSRLTALIESGHKEQVTVPDADRRLIYAWIDANAPYYGTWDMSRPHSMGGRDTWTAPPGATPLPWVQALAQVLGKRGIPCDAIAKPGGAATLEHTRVNLTHPEWSAVLLDNLAESAGGRAPAGKACFATLDDPDYKAALAAIREGARLLLEKPRMDMPGAVPVPQNRDFGLVFGAPRPARPQ